MLAAMTVLVDHAARCAEISLDGYKDALSSELVSVPQGSDGPTFPGFTAAIFPCGQQASDFQCTLAQLAGESTYASCNGAAALCCCRIFLSALYQVCSPLTVHDLAAMTSCSSSAAIRRRARRVASLVLQPAQCCDLLTLPLCPPCMSCADTMHSRRGKLDLLYGKRQFCTCPPLIAGGAPAGTVSSAQPCSAAACPNGIQAEAECDEGSISDVCCNNLDGSCIQSCMAGELSCSYAASLNATTHVHGSPGVPNVWNENAMALASCLFAFANLAALGRSWPTATYTHVPPDLSSAVLCVRKSCYRHDAQGLACRSQRCQLRRRVL